MSGGSTQGGAANASESNGGPPRWFDVMAAQPVADNVPNPAEWVFERKLDGVRILAWVIDGQVSLLSKNRIRQGDVYPEVADDLADAVSVDAVIDGEVVAYDEQGRTSFPRLQRRMHIHNEEKSRLSPVKVNFAAFDLLWVAGRDVRDLPHRDRRRLLEQVVDNTGSVEVLPLLEGAAAELVKRAEAEAWEGVMAKRSESRYQGRRSRDWLKLKVVIQQEMVIIGWTPPEKAGRVGLRAMLLGYHENGRLRYGGKVGTGFTEAELRDLRRRLEEIEADRPPVHDPPRLPGVRWTRPELVAQVGFGEWSESGRMRHPRYLGLRLDTDPGDVVREV